MKILFIDYNYFVFRSIYAWKNNSKINPLNICLSCIISNIKKIGLEKEDIVIFALDSEYSWRKDIDKNYKANRKEIRDKQPFDWEKLFKDYNFLAIQLNKYTPFHFLKIDYCEADDIIAVGCKKFQDTECIIISTDTDFEQLVVYPKVKIFSPLKNNYKTVINPYKVILNKIKKERTDNLISPILSSKDYEKRNSIVNLLKLPEDIEKQINYKLNNLPLKEWDIGSLPYLYSNNRLYDIYKKDKVNDIFKTKRKKIINKKQKKLNF